MIRKHTLHVPTGKRVGFLPLHCKADGNTFQCRLNINPKNADHRGDRSSEVQKLFEEGVKIILLILLLSDFQALIGVFVLVVCAVIIHNIHVGNTVSPLRLEVYDEDTPLQLSLVL